MTKDHPHDKEVLRQIEALITTFQDLVRQGEGTPQEAALVFGLRVLVSLAHMVLKQQDIFGYEPWHVISPKALLSAPAEMLLRVRDYRGAPLAPYPAIMTFYNNGFTTELDSILFLCALGQFQRARTQEGGEKQISINISARSLRDGPFVKATMARLESLDLSPDEKIIVEIHESAPYLSVNPQVLKLYRALGVSFAIDDVGLNMSDVLRLSEFEGLAEYIKIDRHAVNAAVDDSNSLTRTMEFVRAVIPHTAVIAEGVQDAAQAVALARNFPEIHYVQGLYLPPRAEFRSAYKKAVALSS